MKQLPFGYGGHIALLILSLLLTDYASADNSPAVSPPSQAPLKTLSTAEKHPLAMAREHLKQAYQSHQAQDINTVQTHLDAARQWLKSTPVSDDPKTREEATRLGQDIQALQAQISPTATGSASADSNRDSENAISRIWHRSTALVEREIRRAATGWRTASAANATLKHLVDARLHFHFAEHDLFVSHDTSAANTEIRTTLEYLDKASKVANPQVRVDIARLQADIKALSANTARARQSTIANALTTAQAALQTAGQDAPREIRARLQTISSDLNKLKQDVDSLENKQHYEDIMERLQKLDTRL